MLSYHIFSYTKLYHILFIILELLFSYLIYLKFLSLIIYGAMENDWLGHGQQ